MFNVLITPTSQAELESMALLSPLETLAFYELIHLTLGQRKSRLSAVLKLQEYTEIARKHILNPEGSYTYCNELHGVILKDLANIVIELQYLWLEHGLEWDGHNPTLQHMTVSIVNYIVNDLRSGDSEILAIAVQLESTKRLI